MFLGPNFQANFWAKILTKFLANVLVKAFGHYLGNIFVTNLKQIYSPNLTSRFVGYNFGKNLTNWAKFCPKFCAKLLTKLCKKIWQNISPNVYLCFG